MKLVKFSLLLAALSLGACKPERMVPPESGGKAESFSLQIAGEKRSFDLAPYLGEKTVLLAFYTTWCPYCNQSMPYIEDFYRKNKSKNFEAVAVNLDEPEEAVVEFGKKFGLTMPNLLGSQGRFASSYPVRYLPTLYLIGKDGRLIRSFEGFHPSIFEEISKAL